MTVTFKVIRKFVNDVRRAWRYAVASYRNDGAQVAVAFNQDNNIILTDDNCTKFQVFTVSFAEKIVLAEFMQMLVDSDMPCFNVATYEEDTEEEWLSDHGIESDR